MMYELPPQGRGTAEQQLADLREYLVRMARDLDRVGSGSEVVIQQSANKAVSKAQRQTMDSIRTQAEALKALIIKTANEVYSYTDRKVETYVSEYMANSDFGDYYEQIKTQVEETAKQQIAKYDYTSVVQPALTAAENVQDALELYAKELNGQICRGIIEDPQTHEDHLGIAISERLSEYATTTTVEDGGYTYYRLTNDPTMGLYTSTGWQFWIGGQLVGYFSSNDGLLHVPNIMVEERVTFKSDWEITTKGGFGIRYIGG